MTDNVEITTDEMHAIREMSDFDLKMLVSEINDHGWEDARDLIPLIVISETANQGKPS